MDFQLIVAVSGESTVVWTSLPEEVQAKLGEACKVHTFTMKTPINYSLEMDKQKAMLVPDHLGIGLRVDLTLEDPATAVAYLQSWTLTEPLSIEGAKSLHPTLLTAIANGIRRCVNPWAEDLARFFPQLTDSGGESQDTPST